MKKATGLSCLEFMATVVLLTSPSYLAMVNGQQCVQQPCTTYEDCSDGCVCYRNTEKEPGECGPDDASGRSYAYERSNGYHQESSVLSGISAAESALNEFSELALQRQYPPPVPAQQAQSSTSQASPSSSASTSPKDTPSLPPSATKPAGVSSPSSADSAKHSGTASGSSGRPSYTGAKPLNRLQFTGGRPQVRPAPRPVMRPFRRPLRVGR